jgi:hypothetical protein
MSGEQLIEPQQTSLHRGTNHTEAVMPATWPERFANLEKVTGRPSYLKLERDGWVVGAWVLGRSYKRKVKYHGAYPGNLLPRLSALFFDRGPTLHLFSGVVDLTQMSGDTLDINPSLWPTYCVDAETMPGVDLGHYHFVLADPPYSDKDAAKYGTEPISRSKVLKTLIHGLPVGAIVCWVDEVTPVYRSDWPIRWTGYIAVSTSGGHRGRFLYIYQRTA